jgi:hypothetical protein
LAIPINHKLAPLKRGIQICRFFDNPIGRKGPAEVKPRLRERIEREEIAGASIEIIG